MKIPQSREVARASPKIGPSRLAIRLDKGGELMRVERIFDDIQEVGEEPLVASDNDVHTLSKTGDQKVPVEKPKRVEPVFTISVMLVISASALILAAAALAASL